MATNMQKTGGWRDIGWRVLMWGTAACLLMVPLVAMKLAPSSGVNWTGSDFVAMGILLASCCATVEFGAWLSGNLWYRGAYAVAVLAGFLMTWVSMAVGIINELSDPANLMFLGVLATALIGAVASRFKPQGMARTMVATAVVQMLVGLIALVGRMGIEAIAFGSLLSVLWLLSAWLFRKAGPELR
jgi:hypothetical protein